MLIIIHICIDYSVRFIKYTDWSKINKDLEYWWMILHHLMMIFRYDTSTRTKYCIGTGWTGLWQTIDRLINVQHWIPDLRAIIRKWSGRKQTAGDKQEDQKRKQCTGKASERCTVIPYNVCKFVYVSMHSNETEMKLNLWWRSEYAKCKYLAQMESVRK